MVELQRFYTFASFLVIFLTAALLILFFQQVAMHWVLHLTETNHQAVARTAVNSIAPELMAHLDTAADTGERKTGSTGLPDDLVKQIRRMTHDTTVDRIDIYDSNGVRVFSTDEASAETDLGSNAELQSAFGGNVSSSMAFQSIFSRLTGTAETGQLMRTYIPVRGDSSSAITGVLAVHSDISHLVEESDRILLLILVGAEFILAVLYAVLLFVARHAKNVIVTQQTSIQERSASLEVFSRHLLKKEELRKKQIATDLHEGLAQTLSAIKVNVESSELIRASEQNTHSQVAIVPVLQHAIHEVRRIAAELRPSSLDDLGLLPTINWFCREFEFRHPDICIRREISLPEGKIPSRLKVDIYRIIESAFKNIAEHSNTDQIRFVLHLADDMIHLVIGDAPTRQHATTSIVQIVPCADPQFRFAETKERTSLSGGVFSARLEKLCWVTLHASWACGE